MIEGIACHIRYLAYRKRASESARILLSGRSSNLGCNLTQAIVQRRVWFPPQLAHSRTIHQLLRCPVGLAAVPCERATESSCIGNCLREFAYGQVFAIAYIDERQRRLRKCSDDRVPRQRKQHRAGIAQIVAVKEFAARRAGAPDGHARLVFFLCGDGLTQECG